MTDEIIDDWLLTQSPALHFSLEVGCRAESINFLIKAWSFWWPAPILKLSRDLKELLHWKKRDCFQPNHLGNPKDFRGLVPELRTNTKYPSVIPQWSSSASSKMETEGSGSFPAGLLRAQEQGGLTRTAPLPPALYVSRCVINIYLWSTLSRVLNLGASILFKVNIYCCPFCVSNVLGSCLEGNKEWNIISNHKFSAGQLR